MTEKIFLEEMVGLTDEYYDSRWSSMPYIPSDETKIIKYLSRRVRRLEDEVHYLKWIRNRKQRLIKKLLDQLYKMGCQIYWQKGILKWVLPKEKKL